MALSWISGYNNIDYLNQMIRSVEDTLSNDYNDLDNIPIIKIISSTSNPQNIWELKEGMYLIDGIVYVDNNTSYEVSNLFVSMTARLENSKYVLSAFIPFFKGLYEYILKSDSTEYEEHQIVILATHERMLTRYNETPYEPNGDYNPATKKYVDDKANEIITELDNIGVNKETITSLKEENRIRDIKLQALLSETSDRNISISEDTRYFDMPLSIDDGIVTINEMIGDTLVNVCDQEESVAITKSYTVENENHIALQGEYDGSCMPIVYGNTLVNHNADWDGNLQTGVETSASGIEDVQVEGIKGQEVSVVVEGNTVLNHALGKTAAVTTDIAENLVYYGNKDCPIGVAADTLAKYSYKETLKNNTIYTIIVEASGIDEQGDNRPTLSVNSGYNGSAKRFGNGTSIITYDTGDISISDNNKLWVFYSSSSTVTSTNPIIHSIKVLEGDHTTNPKYVNSNNGNYVDLTVANDMSSVVEIEGRTMVNVCDQKDPIAITKSYTVENSGNHIALQGDYDGKCRPVIQGNTLVNLFNLNDVFLSNQASLENTHFTLKTTENKYSNFFFYNKGTFKPSTKYTLVVFIFKNTLSSDDSIFLTSYSGSEYNQSDIFSTSTSDEITLQGGQVGTFIYTLTSKSDISNYTYAGRSFVSNKSGTPDNELDMQLMIFEGDLTQTPELIPTEYVEGLKSSFEDGYIPSENLCTDIWDGNNSTIVATLINVKKNTDYTLVVLKANEINTASVYADNGATVISAYSKEKIRLFNTKDYEQVHIYGRSTNNEMTLDYFKGSVYVLEGDWTHLSEEDFNHLGKYKVEYKVTGKNKFDIEGDITITSGTNRGTLPYVAVYKLKPNTNYTLSYNSSVDGVIMGAYITDIYHEYGTPHNTIHQACINAGQTDYLVRDSFNSKNYDYLYLTCSSGTATDDIIFSSIQIEEGTEVTEYEPYKEYTKTFYLNSPLLEGDTIEDVNGKATHVKRSGREILNGSEGDSSQTSGGKWYRSSVEDNAGQFVYQKVPKKVGFNTSICDKFLNTGNANPYTLGKRKAFTYTDHPDLDRMYFNFGTSDTSMQEWWSWLSENPITIVYELASPIYEPISTESILCDSYVNGHLDFDSAVPIEKVEFYAKGISLKYLKTDTNYAIQFESDKVGILDVITLADINSKTQIDIVKGINKININTTSSDIPYLWLNGIGFNASNIVVTEATDVDFDYFEGLKSSYEYEVAEDGKYKVDVKVTGKNLYNKDKYPFGDGYSLANSSTDVEGFDEVTSRSVMFKLLPNTTYTYSADLTLDSNVGSAELFVLLFDNSNVVTSVNRIGILSTGRYSITFSTDSVGVYCELRFDNNFSKTGNEGIVTIDNIQLEEGTVATSYEPYFESTKTFYLNSPLLEGDKIVTKNGKVYHYHKMGKVVLDGSRTWWGGSNTNGITYMVTTSLFDLGINNRKLLCDSLKVNEGNNQNSLTDYNEILANKLSTYSNACYISTQLSQSDFINWLKSNPTTVVYELDTPYYELIDEYNNTILNIPNTVAHLTHTSTVPVNNTVFTNYIDELNVLEANTQYRVMFDCDTANIPFTVTLGGTSQTVTSKKGTHSLLITTPSTLVDKNLVIDGIGRCGIDNIRIFKGKVEYDYVKGLWSGYEERLISKNLVQYDSWGTQGIDNPSYENNVYNLSFINKYGMYPAFRVKLNTKLDERKVYTVIFKIKTSRLNQLFNVGACIDSGSASWNANVSNKLTVNSVGYKTFAQIVVFRKSDYGNHTHIGFGFDFNRNGEYDNETVLLKDIMVLEGDWTDNPPTYEEVMANEGKYAVKVKLDNPNATIFGKGGRL